jgi:EAL domain-containing protein (putative c-di-GMP-specific phosphodiesterase class I)
VADLQQEFNDIVDHRRIRAVFQPIVELESARTIGYEALARGPEGSHFEQPTRLFEYAYRTGRSAELDWVCRASAVAAAIAAGMPRHVTLFINAEPASLRTNCPPDLLETVQDGVRDLTIVVEITERYLSRDPAGVLDAVAAARASGVGVAIDDVGADPASLAMMPLVRPDVIKLDLSLIQGRPDQEVARTVNGVLAEVERTGATVLAEGIETQRHRALAYSMGATLGQGWKFGRPGPLPQHWQTTPTQVVAVKQATVTPATPFEVVTRRRPTRSATRQLLRSLSRQLEYRAADPADPSVLVACFEDAKHLGAALANEYARIAEAAVMVATFGRGMPPEPAKLVRGTALADDDPLAQEWVVVAVAAHFGAALVARRPRPSIADSTTSSCEDSQDVRYDFAVTYERDLVIAAAHSLVQRISVV